MYREGPLQERPNERPWSLHRTGFAGMQRFGGWNWSGDVNSSWETLKAHVPVGINASMSTSPFWGTDIGGFYPTEDFTGELYVRWFQFGAFVPSFRSHGVVWRTRLPWGWNPGEMGPVQVREYLDTGSLAADTTTLQYRELDLHTDEVEPIIKEFLELRYRLMPYNYSIVRQTHDTGLPPMRAMWLHYPDDPEAVAQSHQYLWGRNMLIAPIVEKRVKGPHDSSLREIYLPEGEWYDFWRPYRTFPGEQYIKQTFELDEMPIYVRAGTILPLDPVRQYVDEPVDEPTTLRIYPGSDGEFELYNDDGRTLDFQEGEYSRTLLSWDDQARTLTIEPSEGDPMDRQFRVEVVGEQDQEQTADYQGEPLQVEFD
jgi:alpha-glucosidase/alpha-D-xyloside xylohydrolase